MNKTYIVKAWSDYYPNNTPGEYTPCEPFIEKEFATSNDAVKFYNSIQLEHDLRASGSYLMNKALWRQGDIEPLKVQYADESVLQKI